MKKSLLILVFFCLSCSSAIINLQVMSEEESKMSGIGTGFFVTNQYIITAAHIFLNKGKIDRVIIKTNNVFGRSVLKADLVELNKEKDFAILRLKKPLDGITPLSFCEKIEPGNPIKIYRRFTDFFLEEREGKIINVLDDKVYTTATGDKGFSGSPIIDQEKGCVVGMVIQIFIYERNKTVGITF